MLEKLIFLLARGATKKLFNILLVDRANDAQRSADYLRLNPNGLIPVLVDDALILYETAAIVLHLVDTHPEAGLAPAVGTAERAHFYKWLIWLTNSLQAALMVWAYPERWVDEGDKAAAQQVQRSSQLRIGGMLDQLEALLQSHGRAWLLGEQFSAVDPFAWMLCRWTRNFDPQITPPARTRPALGAFLTRVLERPSVQRVLADEQLAPPYV